MDVVVNGCRLNVEVLGRDNGPVLIAHHGGGGIGSLAEPKATFGSLSDRFRVIVFDARVSGRGQRRSWSPEDHMADLSPSSTRWRIRSTCRQFCSVTLLRTTAMTNLPLRTPGTRTAFRSTGTTSTGTGRGTSATTRT